jgi:hypothetical protein
MAEDATPESGCRCMERRKGNVAMNTPEAGLDSQRGRTKYFVVGWWGLGGNERKCL